MKTFEFALGVFCLAFAFCAVLGGVLCLAFSFCALLEADYAKACWFMTLGLMDIHIALER